MDQATLEFTENEAQALMDRWAESVVHMLPVLRTPLGTLPHYPFFLDYLGDLESGDDCIIGKSRQMMASWGACSVLVHRLMFRRNYAALVTSRKQQLVDDGGENSTPNSLLGRMRFLYDSLPHPIRAAVPITFTYLKAVCPATGAYVMGESTTPNSGRGGTFDTVLGDEWAYVPQSELAFSSIRLACKRGIWLPSTPNGPDGNFARLWRERPAGFRLRRLHWSDHPLRYDGLEVEEGTGKRTSPWYRQQCESMMPDEIARELDISFEHSASGMVYPEFSYETHVRGTIPFEPDLKLWLGVDPGIGAPTAAVFFQVHGTELRVLADYEMANTPVEVNARNLMSIAKGLGFKGEAKEIRLAVDPAANARDLVRGSTVINEFATCGFTNAITPRVKMADGIRLVKRKLHRKELFVASDCDVFARRIAGYRYHTDDAGNIKGDEPIHDISSHMMDALRYGATACFPLDEFAPVEEQKRPERVVQAIARRDDGRRFRTEDNDAFAPIMGQKRRF